KGVELAKHYNLPLFCGNFTDSSLLPSQELIAWLKQVEADWIALAGFLKIFPTAFSEDVPWKDHIINIHPALLPAFSGKKMYGQYVHQAVLEAGVQETGASVHFVNERYDEGQIIAQIKVPVLEG